MPVDRIPGVTCSFQYSLMQNPSRYLVKRPYCGCGYSLRLAQIIIIIKTNRKIIIIIKANRKIIIIIIKANRKISTCTRISRTRTKENKRKIT